MDVVINWDDHAFNIIKEWIKSNNMDITDEIVKIIVLYAIENKTSLY